MSLWESQMTTCVLMDKTSVPDGESGRRVTWTESEFEFPAAIVFKASVQTKTAEAQGVTSLYTVHTYKSVTLEFHEVFKRKSDGKIFRVTSDGDDDRSPSVAGINMAVVTAEEWRLE